MTRNTRFGLTRRAAATTAALCTILPLTIGVGVSSEPQQRAGKGVDAHLDALQRIADEHGGNRASGTSGDAASMRYVEDVLSTAGYEVERQPFDFLYTERLEESLVTQDGQEHAIVLATYSPSTAADGLDARLAALTGDESRSQGCAAGSYQHADVRDRTAVILQGGCSMDAKQAAAAEAGAAAVIVVNDMAGPAYGWLQKPHDATIPIGSVAPETGELLTSAAERGENATLTLRSLTEQRRTANLLARTSGGDPDRQVISGAHLDSVPEAAGINDNGAAVAVLLESALSWADSPEPPKRQLTFAFWGAEEFDLIGADHFVSSLSDTERAQIDSYLNLEMIGGPNAGLFVLPGEAGPEDGIEPPKGSAALAQQLHSGFTAHDRAAQPWKLDGRSDYAPFMRAGIPASGLQGGSFEVKTEEQEKLWGGTAGEAYDSCYHKACDDRDNINDAILTAHQDAFVHALDWVAGRA